MASTTAAPTAKPSATPQQLMTAREEDHAFLFTALLNAAFRAEELGVTPERFLKMCELIVGVMRQLLMENLG